MALLQDAPDVIHTPSLCPTGLLRVIDIEPPVFIPVTVAEYPVLAAMQIGAADWDVEPTASDRNEIALEHVVPPDGFELMG